jgi:chromosome segregation ATPase
MEKEMGNPAAREEMQELKELKTALQSKNMLMECQIGDYQEETKLLKAKIRGLVKELENTKVCKKIMEEEYQKFKAKVKEREHGMGLGAEVVPKRWNRVQGKLTFPDGRVRVEPKSSERDEDRDVEVLEDRIVDLERASSTQTERIMKYEKFEKTMRDVVQNLKSQLEEAKEGKLALETERSSLLSKLESVSLSWQKQLKEKGEEIRRVQEERDEAVERESYMASRFERQGAEF